MSYRKPIQMLSLCMPLLAACGESHEEPQGFEPVVAFDTARVQLATASDTVPLRVEVAATEDQRAYGLMERSSLPPDAGMLFTYPEQQSPEAGYWMYRTRIPLDIAFLDSAGRIVAILPMEPCTSTDPHWCPSYPPGVPYRAALEVNRGYFAQRNISPGDRVLVPDSLLPNTRQ